MRIGRISVSNPLALVYTEFTSSEALIRDARKSLAKIRVVNEERPVAIQIFGGVETSMEGATRIAERANPDFIDINCGCWVKKVALREAGAGLLRDLAKFEAIVKSVIGATALPVTVKTRLGWDERSIVIVDVARMVEQAGAQALAIHCRTRDQGHRGNADWSWLEKVKQAVSIPIIGNGDVNTPEDVKRMFETGCDGVMIGRGAIQNPWIFSQAKHYLATGEHLPGPSVSERIHMCVEHLNLCVRERGEQRAVIEFRKHYSGYLRGLRNAAKLRSELMQHTTLDSVLTRLHVFEEECLSEAVA